MATGDRGSEHGYCCISSPIALGVQFILFSAASARNGAMVRACLCKKWGPPSSLEIVDDLPLPSPRKGEVRIRVSACGVNYPDLLIVQVQDTGYCGYTTVMYRSVATGQSETGGVPGMPCGIISSH